MANFCKKCGMQLLPDDRFCPNCGAPTAVKNPGQSARMPAPPEAPQYRAPQQAYPQQAYPQQPQMQGRAMQPYPAQSAMAPAPAKPAKRTDVFLILLIIFAVLFVAEAAVACFVKPGWFRGWFGEGVRIEQSVDVSVEDSI